MLVDVGDLTCRHLGGSAMCDSYGQALRSAFLASPPIYATTGFADHYRKRARDRSWFASLLVSDCDLEGYSAGQLARYASEVGDERFACGLIAHAADEARHSRIFASLLVGVFPQLEDTALREKLAGMAPRLKSRGYGSTVGFGAVDEGLLSSAILINLHEVKALVLEHLLRPLALAHAPEANRGKIGRQLQVLIEDEVQHIRYSAEYIRHAAASGWDAAITEMMAEYQALMNEVTEQEIETGACDPLVADALS